MYYLFVYDDDQQDCILYGVSDKNDFVDIKQSLKNQGVGYKVVGGEVVEEYDGVVFGDGDDIWEPVDDDRYIDVDEEDDLGEYYSNSNDWEPEENWVDEDRPY